MISAAFGTIISLASGANTVIDLYKNVSGLWKGQNIDRMLDGLHRINASIERLSDTIIYAPTFEGVVDTTRKVQNKVQDLRLVRQALEPVQRVMGDTMLSSGLIVTPERMQEEIAKNAWDVFDEVRPYDKFYRHPNPIMVPVMFTHGGVPYVGWLKRGLLRGAFNCDLTELPGLGGDAGASEPQRIAAAKATAAPHNAVLEDLRRTWANLPAKSDPAAVEKFLLRVRSAPSGVGSGLEYEIEEELAALLRPSREFRDGPGLPLMVVIPAGTFLMGSPETERKRAQDEGPQRKVTIARPFAVGKYAVTFDEWDASAKEGGCPSNPNPSDEGWERGTRPVINVSWHDAQEYVTWLSKKTGKTYRLLSEAEWEYACRAGKAAPFSFGETISTKQANYDGNYTYGAGVKGEYRRKTVLVGSLPSNPFGLHEMHGNVWEWAQDCYGPYAEAPSDGSPSEKSSGSLRVGRGGSWFISPQLLRSAGRGGFRPSDRSNCLGFRLARTL